MSASPQRSGDETVVVGWVRRFLALFIDWFVALLSVSAVTGRPILGGTGDSSWPPLVAFWVEVTVLTGLLGLTIGKRITGIKVTGVDNRPIGLARAALRTFLLCLVLPALVQNADRRGLHDLAAGSRVVPIRHHG